MGGFKRNFWNMYIIFFQNWWFRKKRLISHLSNLCFKILTLIFFYFPFNVTSYMEFYPEHVWQIFYGINLQISHFCVCNHLNTLKLLLAYINVIIDMFIVIIIIFIIIVIGIDSIKTSKRNNYKYSVDLIPKQK